LQNRTNEKTVKSRKTQTLEKTILQFIGFCNFLDVAVFLGLLVFVFSSFPEFAMFSILHFCCFCDFLHSAVSLILQFGSLGIFLNVGSRVPSFISILLGPGRAWSEKDEAGGYTETPSPESARETKAYSGCYFSCS